MPFAGFKDFAACTSAQIRRGKSPESAKKICGALQAKAEGKTKNAAASQVPATFTPHLNRSQKALDFLKAQGVLKEDDNDYDTSFVNTPVTTSSDNNSDMTSNSTDNVVFKDPEPYADKVTRIMDEYELGEEEARVIVNKLIEDDMKELERREYEVTKQLQIEKAQQSEQQQPPQQEEAREENVQPAPEQEQGQ